MQAHTHPLYLPAPRKTLCVPTTYNHSDSHYTSSCLSCFLPLSLLLLTPSLFRCKSIQLDLAPFSSPKNHDSDSGQQRLRKMQTQFSFIGRWGGGFGKWSCSSLGAKWKMVFKWCSVQRKYISLREMNRPCEESQPKLNLMTHVPLSSSLARGEKPQLCFHTTHRRNAQFATLEFGAKTEPKQGWWLAF